MSIENNNIVGKTIKRLRMSQGLSLRELADELSISYPGLSKMENGTQKIDTDLLMEFSKYFGVDVNTLLGIDDTSGGIEYPPIISDSTRRDYKIKGALEHVLKDYLEARTEEFTSHDMAVFIRGELRKILEEDTSLNRDRYIVDSSPGRGVWATVPWLATFDKSITTKATEGYYLVYLFKADMSGVYISMNQGWTYFDEKYGTKEGRIKIKKTAELVRTQLNTVPIHLQEKEIDLASNNPLAKGYESAHVFGKYYDLNDFSSSEELVNDYNALLLAYQELSKLIGGRSFQEFNDFLLLEDDDKYLEENEEKFQDSVNEKTIDEEREPVLEVEPRDRQDPIIDNRGRIRWARSAKEASDALILSEYKCTYDKSHNTFISKKTGESFMELHHLVPMSLQGEMNCDLDRSQNIKSLCPLCHRKIHHGKSDLVIKMLEKLYYGCRDELESIGIEITFTELKKAYNIENRYLV